MSERALLSISCTAEQKAHWDAMVDQLGYRSMSAMVRDALNRLLVAEIGTLPVVVRRRHVDSEATEGDR